MSRRVLTRLATGNPDIDRVQDQLVELVNPVLAATRLELVTEQPTIGGFSTSLVRAAQVNPVTASVRAVVPSSSSSPGSPGQVCADLSWLYICVGPNIWRRVAVGAF